MNLTIKQQRVVSSQDLVQSTTSSTGYMPDKRPVATAQRKLLQSINQSIAAKSLGRFGTAPVQLKQIMLHYSNGVVARIASNNVTLSQLQSLLMHPGVHAESKVAIQEAIDAGEYQEESMIEDTPEVAESTSTPSATKEDMPPPPPPAPRRRNIGVSTALSSPSASGLMLPPPPRLSSRQGLGASTAVSTSGALSLMPPPSGIPSFGRGSKLGAMSAMSSAGGFKKPAPPRRRQQMSSTASSSASGYLTLYRGVHSAEQAAAIEAAGSAGGDQPNPDAPPPTMQQVVGQVGMDEVAPWASRGTPFRQQEVVEFTISLRTAQSYGTRGGVIEVKIDRRYLSRGDVGASGWICLKSAPVIFVRHISK